MTDPKFFRQYLDILNEGPPPGIGPNAPVKPAPRPLNVPPGWQAVTQPDGSTRISKIGSKSRAEYQKIMSDWKAKQNDPEYQRQIAASLNKPKVEVTGRVPGQDFTVSNLEILKNLVDPQAIERFKKQEQEFGQAPMSQDEVKKDILPMITHFDDPQGTALIALNTGMAPGEVLKYIPKDFSLSPAQPAAGQPPAAQPPAQ